MISLEEMLIRIGAAIVLGLLIGLEREVIGKESGLKTNMLVTVGSALFTIAGISLPYVISKETNNLADVIARNSGFLGVIANIVVGVGFLGAGVIVKEGIHVRSVTTAAIIWFDAAIGILCGIGFIKLAFIVTVAILVLLFILMKVETKIHPLPLPQKNEYE